MDFIMVLAKIEPKSGCSDSVVELSKELIENTISESGNIDYQLLQSTNEDYLTFIEKWESLDALKEHMASTHFVNFSDESKEFIENMEIQVLSASDIDL